MPQHFLDTAGRRSLQGRYAIEQPATDIADSLMTNPWTAALVSGSTIEQDVYDKGSALTRAGLGTWDEPYWCSKSHAAGKAAEQPDQAAAAACDLGQDNHREPDAQYAACTPLDTGTDNGRPQQAQDAGNCKEQASSGTGEVTCHQSGDRPGHLGNTFAGSESCSSSQEAEEPTEPLAAKADDRAAGLAGSHGNSQPVSPETAPAALHGSNSQQQAAKQQDVTQNPQQLKDFSSWIGDYGHLDLPRFTAARSHAWQAELHNRRDCPVQAADMQDKVDSPAQV